MHVPSTRGVSSTTRRYLSCPLFPSSSAIALRLDVRSPHRQRFSTERARAGQRSKQQDARPPPRSRSNDYFLCIPISTQASKAAFLRVSRALSRFSALSPSSSPLRALARTGTDYAGAHISLWVLHLFPHEEADACALLHSLLADPASVEASRVASQSPSSPVVSSTIQPGSQSRERHLSRLTLDSVGDFSRKVLYFSVRQDEQREKLDRLAASLRDAFSQRGWLRSSDQDGDGKTIVPHVTVAKLSLLKGRRRSDLPEFPADLIRAVAKEQAGVQSPLCVRLCRIRGRRQGQFYDTLTEVAL